MEIKFRQALMVAGQFTGWHYWGFIAGKYISPATSDDSFASFGAKNNQQFTGLLDRNGKEIYDGDLFFTSKFADKPRIARWNGELARFELGLEGNNETDKAYPLNIVNHLEVIGNKWQNPELLESAR